MGISQMIIMTAISSRKEPPSLETCGLSIIHLCITRILTHLNHDVSSTIPNSGMQSPSRPVRRYRLHSDGADEFVQENILPRIRCSLLLRSYAGLSMFESLWMKMGKLRRRIRMLIRMVDLIFDLILLESMSDVGKC